MNKAVIVAIPVVCRNFYYAEPHFRTLYSVVRIAKKNTDKIFRYLEERKEEGRRERRGGDIYPLTRNLFKKLSCGWIQFLFLLLLKVRSRTNHVFDAPRNRKRSKARLLENNGNYSF